MTVRLGYLRGAFIAYEPGGYPDRKRVIPFRFNPGELSRQVAVEQGETSGGMETPAGEAGGGEPSEEQAADAASGAVKESFSVSLLFDFADRLEATRNLPEELGVAPEIAAVEDLLYPAESESDAAVDGTEPVRPRQPRPTVLFVWGRKRVLPVRLTSITVNETVYNNQLNPVRATLEVALEVLGEAAARDNEAVSSALAFSHDNRRRMARLFYDETAEQSANILPL